MKPALLHIKNLQVAFAHGKEQRPAVQDITFHVNEREIVGIVGESGCGKSLTSLSVMGLLPNNAKVTNGEIVLNNTNLVELSTKDWNSIRGKHVSMIFQDPMTALNPLLPIGKQISEALLAHFSLSKSEAKQKTLEMMQKVGLPRVVELYKEYPHQLSGGMKQRVMIAMALICEPDLIIADEPTTALDVTIQAQILDLIKEINQETRTAFIFISHDLGVIKEICDRVLVMYAGYIVEEGTVEELFTNPKHPYTVGLLNSIPDASKRGQELYTIPGRVPALDARGEGCPFVSRCPGAMDVCKQTIPMLEQNGRQFVRCHLYTEVGASFA